MVRPARTLQRFGSLVEAVCLKKLALSTNGRREFALKVDVAIRVLTGRTVLRDRPERFFEPVWFHEANSIRLTSKGAQIFRGSSFGCGLQNEI